MIGKYSGGYKFRVNAEVAENINLAKEESFSNELCEKNIQQDFPKSKYCMLVPNKKKFAFIFGDSHAGVLMLEAKKAFSKIKKSSKQGHPTTRLF